MKTIAIANHKGGIGKTTTTLNLGAGLSMMGKRVLLIDMDPQMNLSQGLGIYEADKTIHEALSGKCKLTPHKITDTLSIVPSTTNLRNLETEFISRIGGQVRLKKVLSDVEGYDYIFIDCPPSLGLLTTNALTATDEVIIPITPEFYSVQGIVNLTQIIEEVRETLNPNIQLTGIIINLYNKQKVLHRDVCKTIEQQFGGIVYETKIRSSVAIEEAPYQGMDVFRYDKASNGAEDYGKLCREFLSRYLL